MIETLKLMFGKKVPGPSYPDRPVINDQAFDNTNTASFHCEMCITVCPMDVLSYDNDARKEMGIVEQKSS